MSPLSNLKGVLIVLPIANCQHIIYLPLNRTNARKPFRTSDKVAPAKLRSTSETQSTGLGWMGAMLTQGCARFAIILLSTRYSGVSPRSIFTLLNCNCLFKLEILWCLNSKFLWVHLKFQQNEHTPGVITQAKIRRCCSYSDLTFLKKNVILFSS